MPWKIRPKGGQFEVVNEQTGKVEATHPSQMKAKAHLAALYANVKDAGKPVAKAAPAAPQDDAWGVEVPIQKTMGEGRFVFGFAKVSTVGGQPHEDLERDLVDTEELAKAAYGFVLTGREGKVNHAGSPVASLIESVVLTHEKLAKMGVPEDVAKTCPEGWWVGFDIHDEATRERVRTGELRSFSIGGKAIRQEV